MPERAADPAADGHGAAPGTALAPPAVRSAAAGRHDEGPERAVDGAIGPKTLSALKIILENKARAENLVHALNCMQGAHYLELAAKKSSQRKYTVGWMKRTYCELSHG